MLRSFLVLAALCGLPAAAQESITVDQLFEKHIAAIGGREALEKFQSAIMTGSFELPVMGASGSVTVHAKAPNKRLAVINIDGFGEIFQGFDGERGFSVSPMGSIDFSGQMLEDAKRDAVFHQELYWKELYPKIEIRGKEKVGDREAWAVVMTPEKGKPMTAWFDAESFLLLKTSAVRMTDQGEAEITTEFSDYREVPGTGVKMAHQMKQVLPVGEVIMRFKEIQANAAIDDAKFAKP
jgi:hypothetical protein